MAQTKKKKTTKKTNSKMANVSTRTNTVSTRAPHRREIGALICLFLGVFSFLGYFNTEAVFIDFFSSLVKGLTGWGFYALPPALILCAMILGFHRGRPVRFRVTCALLIPVFVGALTQLFFSKMEYDLSFSMFKALWLDGTTLTGGGAIGGALTVVFSYLFSKIGAGIVFFSMFVFLLLAAFNRTLSGIIDAFKNRPRREYEPIPEPESEPKTIPTFGRKQNIPVSIEKKPFMNIDIPVDEPRKIDEFEAIERKNSLFNKKPRVKTPDQMITGEDNSEANEIGVNIDHIGKPIHEEIHATEKKTEAKKPDEAKIIPIEPIIRDDETHRYFFPPLDLLCIGAPGSRLDGKEEIRLNSERLEAAFLSFGININVSNVTRGPTVTRYEMELEAGVKLNRLTNLADDIALSLGTNGVRIAAIPNKISTVGIEVPNKLVSKVYLREIIDSQEFRNASSKLTFAIGKNIGGEAIVGNISKLPHLLVAGTTGSGKSVCLNSLILSILYKATPEEVKFIMIDPKMVEFRVYNGIPHLLVPVVTEVKKAAGALQWAVVEMMKRYRLFSETGARDLESYNKSILGVEDTKALPQIIVVIDELADLMLTAAKEVEESVCRVAQMGRAAGVHLIIATQSPRADVITGLMKANIPSRISLKVSSALESRIILDAGGNADKLVGNGDMLYAPIGTTKPVRIQGTWVSDSEREKVVEYIKKSGETQYSEDVIRLIDKAAEEKSSGEKSEHSTVSKDDGDELLPQAVEVILESGQASVSMLQRRLKLGYSRAARLVDQMEERGIVGPFEGSKPRQLLITKQQWREMQFISGNAPIDQGQAYAEALSQDTDELS